MQSYYHQNEGKHLDVILSGGPPWGFTLSGGSEFGSKLYIKKVTTSDKKTVQGQLLEGDEIVSVNGINCTSRANAIQMVRNVEEDLQLKIYRWNTNNQNTNATQRYETNQQHVYDNMVETMSDLSKSIYSMKRTPIQQKSKHLNNNDANTTYTYSDHHQPSSSSTRLLTKSHTISERLMGDAEYRERLVDGDHNVRNISRSVPTTPQFPQRQKVTVKVVPAATSNTTHYPSNTSTLHSTNDGIDQTDSVEHESVQKVSKALQMFESMSTSKLETVNVARPKLKSWNSGGSLLDERNGEKKWHVQPQQELKPADIPQQPLHKHSRSLPIEIAGKEFEKAMAAYRQSALNPTTTATPSSHDDRPRPSTFYIESQQQRTDQVGPISQRYSQSDIFQHYRVKSNQEHSEQLPGSYSTDNVHDLTKRASLGAVIGASSGGKNDPANELRQASNRYHEELRKNYPKFRYSISGKDFLSPKFNANRKTSMPEDAFSRGEPLRATLHTDSPTRIFSRAHTVGESTSPEMNIVKDVLSKPHENPMMLRLLQGQSPALLMKIEEEAAKSRRMNSTESPPLIRSNSAGKPLRRSSIESSQDLPSPCFPAKTGNSLLEDTNRDVCITPDTKSICIQTEPGPDDETNVHRARGMSDVQTSTDTLVRRYSNNENNLQSKKPSLTRETAIDPPPFDRKSPIEPPPTSYVDRNTPFHHNVSVGSDRSFVNDFEPAQFADVATNELVSELQSKDRNNSPASAPMLTAHKQQGSPPNNLIDRSNIVHSKTPSTDSAVYVMHGSPSTKSLLNINERNNSANEFANISMSSSMFEREHQKMHNSKEHLEQPRYQSGGNAESPPLREEYLHDQQECITEKEKPQRTINRKKKEPGAVSSRNNSCVSTDSTTSTGTVDSGIVVRSDPSPRTSPTSASDQYYDSKELSISRETLDGDMNDLGDDLHITSTPERHDDNSYSRNFLSDNTAGSPVNEYMSGDNHHFESIADPGLDDLDSEKSKLIESMREKINELGEQEQEIADEIKGNEELGKKVLGMVEAKATQSEFSKYELFIGELNKIVALLLSLTQRLHRYEMNLQDLDMSNESDKLKKDNLISKIEKLKSQHEEACYLRDVNDKRGDNVAIFLEKYCSEEEFADFQYYVDMKSQLALMQSEIREKVKLGEERLKALEDTGADWGIG